METLRRGQCEERNVFSPHSVINAPFIARIAHLEQGSAEVDASAQRTLISQARGRGEHRFITDRPR